MSAPWVFGGTAGVIPIGAFNVTSILPFPCNMIGSGICAFITTDPTDPIASPSYAPFQCKAGLEFMTFLQFLKKFTITPGTSGSGSPITTDRSDPTGALGGPFVMQQCMFEVAIAFDIFVSYMDATTGNNWQWEVRLNAAPRAVSYQSDFYHRMTYVENDVANGFNYTLDPLAGPLNGGFAAGSFNAFGYTVPIYSPQMGATAISPTATVVTAW